MKDILSRATFGLLMAQLVPGGLVLLSLFMVITVAQHGPWTSLASLSQHCLEIAFSTPEAGLISVVVAFAFGMLLHGVNWAVIAFFEQQEDTVFRTWWHERPLYQQILLAPLQMPTECLSLVLRATRIRHAALAENVALIPLDRMEQFRFVQEFYLNFAQFYAHASYALGGSVVCQLALIGAMGATPWRVGLALVTYLLAGSFFVLGRIQFNSLFRAEQDLLPVDKQNARDDHESPSPRYSARPVLITSAAVFLVISVTIAGAASTRSSSELAALIGNTHVLVAIAVGAGLLGSWSLLALRPKNQKDE